MPRWTLDDIPWDSFDAAKLSPAILRLVKAAALTESNAARYTAYLDNVFHDDPDFRAQAREWRAEEEQHGRALARYAEQADPGFDYAAAFTAFTEGYVIPIDVEESIRGSRVGEMVARCVVETGTSSFYTALADAAGEPVLVEICRRIAADEFRHYKMFLDCQRRYLDRERVSRVVRMRVAFGRLRESDDDELAFAYHCANPTGEPYDRARANAEYGALAFAIYRIDHVERAAGMVLKAAGLKPHGWLGKGFTQVAWRMMRGRARRLAEAA